MCAVFAKEKFRDGKLEFIDAPEVALELWMGQNGRDLRFKTNESWVCLHVFSSTEVRVAHKLSKLKLPFFLPLTYDFAKQRAKPLWPSYVFCRVNPETLHIVREKIDFIRTLETAFQSKLLKQLGQTPPFINVQRNYEPVVSDMVHVVAGPLKGQRAFVTKTTADEGIEVSIDGFRSWNHVVLKRSDLRPVNASSDTAVLLPLRIKMEQSEIEEPLNLELCDINAELMAYLNKHPSLLYSLAPRKFELLVADILTDMGYDVTVTPQTRDGGVDIIAAFKSPIGPIMTIVECKKWDPDRKIGIDIIERFLYTIRDKFRAACGLIATTSFFSPDSARTQRDYHWQLFLRDFDGIKEWLSKYGHWSADKQSGLWMPASLAPQKTSVPLSVVPAQPPPPNVGI